MNNHTYNFNQYGVCTNPDVEEFEAGHCRYEIKTATIGGNWVVGFFFSKSANGVGSPCTECNGTFQTREDARKHAAQRALAFFNDDHYTDDNSHVPKEIFEKLQDIIKPAPRQMSLFDDL